MLSSIRFYAIGGALLGAVGLYTYHTRTVSNLEASVTSAQIATKDAKDALAQRILAEAVTIAKLVSEAQQVERLAKLKLQEDYDQLKTNAVADFGRLTAARIRLHQLASSAPASTSSPDLPGSPTAPTGVRRAPEAGLPPADRVFIDGLLQLAADANASAGERNFLAAQYEMNCRSLPSVR